MKIDFEKYTNSELSPEEIKAERRKTNQQEKLIERHQRKEETFSDAIESYNDSRDVVECARDDYLGAVRRAVEEMGSDAEEFTMDIPGRLKMPDNSPTDRFARYFDFQDCIETE